jgi:hypothetical protein
MLQNWSDQVNDPVLIKFCLGSVRVQHSIPQALHEKATNKVGTMKATTMKIIKRMKLLYNHKT